MKKIKNKLTFIHCLAIYGSISSAIIYMSIGVIAILSFLKIRDGGADESSVIAVLNDYFIGKIFIWIILTGTTSYIIWRIYETITDPYDYGSEIKGVIKRTGIALSTTADALIAYAAIQVLLGTSHIEVNGQPTEERHLVKTLLVESWGVGVIITTGFIILITALVQLLYGVTQGYKERVDIDHFSKTVKKAIHVFAWIGYAARGIILGIIGFFFVKAGILKNARYIVNTDKAFDYIGDNVGHVYFILVALGTICYGLFMLTLGITYDIDKD